MGHSLRIRYKLLSRLRPLKKRGWGWFCRCPAKHRFGGPCLRGEGPESSSPKVGQSEVFGVSQQLSFGAANRRRHFPFVAFIRCSFFVSLLLSPAACACFIAAGSMGSAGQGVSRVSLGEWLEEKSSWSEDRQKRILQNSRGTDLEELWTSWSLRAAFLGEKSR